MENIGKLSGILLATGLTFTNYSPLESNARGDDIRHAGRDNTLLCAQEQRRSYEIGNNKFLIGESGRLSERDAKDILESAQKEYEESEHLLYEGKTQSSHKSVPNKQYPVLSKIWQDLHEVYKGELYGAIELYALKAHLNASFKHLKGQSVRFVGKSTESKSRSLSSYKGFFTLLNIKDLLSFEEEEYRFPGVVYNGGEIYVDGYDYDDLELRCSSEFGKIFEESNKTIIKRFNDRLPSDDSIRNKELDELYLSVVRKSSEDLKNFKGCNMARIYGRIFIPHFNDRKKLQDLIDFSKEKGLGLKMPEKKKQDF
ncbi:MAG: hypothetical protein AABX83_01615 [Nanoarchaeota archaeon]